MSTSIVGKLPWAAWAAAILAVMAAASACADRPRPAYAAGVVPAQPVPGGAFLRNAPHVRGEPADTLRLLRSLGDTSGFGHVDRVVELGNRLLVLDDLMNPHLAVIDLTSGAITEHFGRDGAGPKEFRAPMWAFAAGDPSQAWVYDYLNTRLTLVDLSADPDHRISRTMLLKPDATLQSPVWNGDTIVANGIFPEYSLMVMNAVGLPVRRLTANPPYHYRDLAHWVALKQLNRTFMTASPSGRRIALAYQWDDRLDFFTGNGAFLGTTRGPRTTHARYHLNNGRFFWNDDTEMSYCDVAASDRYVFALYAGPAPDTPFVHHPTHVQVFTWNGQFVRELALDHPVWSISIGRDGRTIYAPYEEPGGHLLVGMWRLPASLDARVPGRLTANVPAVRPTG